MMSPPSTGLLVHSGALGDFLLALTLVQGLLDRFPRWNILARMPQAALACRMDAVCRVMDIEGGGFHLLFRDGPAPGSTLQGALEGHGLVLNLTGQGPQSPLARHLNRWQCRRIVHVPPQPRPDCDQHITGQWATDSAAQGLAIVPQSPRLGRSLHRTARRILIHPGSGGREKCWPLENFMELAQRLRRGGWETAYLIGPVEEERWAGPPLERLAASAPLLRNLTLDRLAEAMLDARTVIANDSGAAHLAASLGTPAVVLFGPSTRLERWRPLGSHVTALGGGCWPEMDQVLAAVEAVAEHGAPTQPEG